MEIHIEITGDVKSSGKRAALAGFIRNALTYGIFDRTFSRDHEEFKDDHILVSTRYEKTASELGKETETLEIFQKELLAQGIDISDAEVAKEIIKLLLLTQQVFGKQEEPIPSHIIPENENNEQCIRLLIESGLMISKDNEIPGKFVGMIAVPHHLGEQFKQSLEKYVKESNPTALLVLLTSAGLMK